MSRLTTKRRGLDATRLICFQNPEGVEAQTIANRLNIHLATAYRWLHEIGASQIGDSLWVLVPSEADIAMAEAILGAAYHHTSKKAHP